MKVFYTPATADHYPNIIDTVVEIDGAQIGQFSRETLEQIQKRYPGAQVGEALEVAEQREAMMISEPERITEEQFNDALECLPPEGWVRNQHTESFKMCEYYSGRITSIYARFADTYWTFKDIGSKTHVEIMDKVSKVAVAATKPPQDVKIPCSISDDDLCSGCEHHSCHVQCGNVCAAGFPATLNADGYIVSCIKFVPYVEQEPYDDREDYAKCGE